MKLAIDPFDLNGPWDTYRLQAWFIFGVCVAGKSAKQTAEKVTQFCRPYMLPFDSIRLMILSGTLEYRLKEVRMGQYKRIEKALKALVLTDPAQVSFEHLQTIVGPKTARMLLLYTRPNFTGVPLDTHILKYLHAMGVPKVPAATPSSKREYARLEGAFQEFALMRRLTVKELDTQVWKSYATK